MEVYILTSEYGWHYEGKYFSILGAFPTLDRAIENGNECLKACNIDKQITKDNYKGEMFYCGSSDDFDYSYIRIVERKLDELMFELDDLPWKSMDDWRVV